MKVFIFLLFTLKCSETVVETVYDQEQYTLK